MLPSAAREYYGAQQQLAAATVLTARRVWAQIDPADFDASWDRFAGGRLATITSAAQQRATRDAAAYVPTVLTEQGIDAASSGTVAPWSLAGVASSGVPIEQVLYVPVIRAKQAVGAGATGQAALDGALATLEGIVLTQIADAGRAAVGVGLVASRKASGYVRMLVEPSCSRCAVLAGRIYRWNAGFRRHPRCDCRHIPTSENVAGDLRTDPKAYFDSLDNPTQDRIFTKAGAEAIRDGSDIGQVVNARRGMTSAGTTLEGTTRRGFAGKRLSGPFDKAGTERYARTRTARLMPERIYEMAGNNRDEAIRLLRQHGYLV